MEELYYVLFPNHDNAMRLYQVLRERQVPARIAPTPRALSKCCGVALLIEPDDIPLIRDCVYENEIQILGIEHTPKDINPGRDRYC